MRTPTKVLAFCMLLSLLCVTQWVYAENWALIVGINKYEKIRPNLSFCVPDAKLFRDSLLKYSGFDEAHIKTLFDEQATKANIRDAFLNWLVTNVQPGDMAVFYFSGHGVQLPDVNGDEEDGQDEVLVAYDSYRIDTKFIVDDELSRWMSRIPTTNKIVVLDSCHSGTGVRAIDPDVQVREYYPEEPIEITGSRAAEPPGPQFQKTSLLSACDANQVALESRSLGHGVFTYYLSQSLSGKADQDGDGRISVREAEDYAVQKIKGDGWEQDPQLEGEYAEQYLVGDGQVIEPYGIVTAIQGGDTYTLALGEKDEATVGSLYAVFSPDVSRTEGTGKGLIEISEVGADQSRAKLFQVAGAIQVGDRVVEYRRKLSFEDLRVRSDPVEGSASDTLRTALDEMIMDQLKEQGHVELVTGQGEWTDRVLKAMLEPNPSKTDTYRLVASLDNPLRQTQGKEYSLIFTWSKRADAIRTILGPKSIGGELAGAYALKELSKFSNPSAPPVKVELNINKGAHGVYDVGDQLSVTATVDKDCWLTLLDIGSSGSITVLFPNQGQPDNKVRAGEAVEVPGLGYRLRVGGPPGSEIIKAIATLEPLSLAALNAEDLKQRFNFMSGEASGEFTRALTSKDLFIEPEDEKALDTDRWAVASIHFRIAPEELYKQQRSVFELSPFE